jgi:hypothetical protein
MKRKKVLMLRKNGFRIWLIAEELKMAPWDVAKCLMQHNGETIGVLCHPREERK